jgi:hypothetical protein
VTSAAIDAQGFGFSEDGRWNVGDVPLLDTTHPETGVYYRTRWDCTGVSFGPPLPTRDVPLPRGDTNMFIEEKRAVIVRGRARAVWPLTHAIGTWCWWRLLVAGPALSEVLVLGAGDSAFISGVVADAERLSGQTGRPVVVARQLEVHGWH